MFNKNRQIFNLTHARKCKFIILYLKQKLHYIKIIIERKVVNHRCGIIRLIRENMCIWKKRLSKTIGLIHGFYTEFYNHKSTYYNETPTIMNESHKLLAKLPEPLLSPSFNNCKSKNHTFLCNNFAYYVEHIYFVRHTLLLDYILIRDLNYSEYTCYRYNTKY